jgi:RecJ-like exonuclease
MNNARKLHHNTNIDFALLTDGDEMICPVCKGAVTESCKGCRGAGYTAPKCRSCGSHHPEDTFVSIDDVTTCFSYDCMEIYNYDQVIEAVYRACAGTIRNIIVPLQPKRPS